MLPNYSPLQGLQSQNYEEPLRNSESLNDSEQILVISTQKLTQSKNKLQAFIQKNWETIHHPISQDVIQYINVTRQRTLISHNISHQFIIKHAKARINKMVKNKKIKRNWSFDDIRMLVWIISAYCNIHGRKHSDLGHGDWQEISSMIPGTDGETVMFKWLGLRKNNLAMEQWREHEKTLLKQIIQSVGSENWSEVAKLLYKMNTSPNKIYRGPKQCRQHWNCYLNPELKKGPWDEAQDQLLMSLVHRFQGQKKWALFVKQFGGRTENALKNRYYLLLERQKKRSPMKSKNPKQLEIVDSFLKRTGTFENKNQNIENRQSFENSARSINESSDSIKEPEQKTIRRKTKKGSRKTDEDWITGFKNKHYTTYRKLEKSMEKNKSKLTLKKNKRLEAQKNELEKTRKKSHEKESNIDGDHFQKEQMSLSRNLMMNFERDRQSEILPKIPVSSLDHEFYHLHSNIKEEEQQGGDEGSRQFSGINLQNEDSIPLQNINVIQITKEKLEQLKMKTFSYIPCQLLEDRLKLLKYPIKQQKQQKQK